RRGARPPGRAPTGGPPPPSPQGGGGVQRAAGGGRPPRGPRGGGPAGGGGAARPPPAGGGGAGGRAAEHRPAGVGRPARRGPEVPVSGRRWAIPPASASRSWAGIVALLTLISAGDERRHRESAILAATPRRDP